MATLFGIIAVVLTIAIIFGRRVARWVVILGVGTVVLVVAGVLIFYQWSYWSSGRMELEEITNRARLHRRQGRVSSTLSCHSASPRLKFAKPESISGEV